MENKRSKKTNLLTKDIELAELAYVFHICAIKLRETIVQINVPAAYRLRVLRHVQWLTDQARSLGIELSIPNADAFASRDAAEKIAEELGVFKS
jgi:hypothetical protein